MIRPDLDGLPFVDEHRIIAPASPASTWRTLARQLGGGRGAGATALARLLAAEPGRATGTLFDEGAALPGFAVTEAVPGRLVRLTGRHRYARYVWLFTLTPVSGGTMISARTYAAFPGPLGRLYRLLVIGSGGHRVAVRRLLRAVRDRVGR
ncbi:hypothetical protein [Micromonospora auratinigra]|uniref:Polyketide cyclase / dehydrase and lipid transport n=1 Tax=Micromonospora auratinigra TaxID=261654 RepID=A0A1A8Z5V1_9ACTN|nr:hypothetical protein [Micromonospora auratinigra]SBT39193.1 hypothetical protein GA0070611_0823 [Micromonospora auratinigra]